MKKILGVGVIVSLLAAPIVVNAGEGDINPWTECGIGAMIFTENKPLAVISNVIWDLGTTAVTSAGLSKNTCGGSNVVAAAFIQNGYANLEEETVIGNGQHLSALLNVFGCESTSHQAVSQGLRAELNGAMQQEEYMDKSTTEKAEAYYFMVKEQASGQCKVS